MSTLLMAGAVLFGGLAGYWLGGRRAWNRARLWMDAGDFSHAVLLRKAMDDLEAGRPEEAAALLRMLADSWTERWQRREEARDPAAEGPDLRPAQRLNEQLAARSACADGRAGVEDDGK